MGRGKYGCFLKLIDCKISTIPLDQHFEMFETLLSKWEFPDHQAEKVLNPRPVLNDIREMLRGPSTNENMELPGLHFLNKHNGITVDAFKFNPLPATNKNPLFEIVASTTLSGTIWYRKTKTTVKKNASPAHYLLGAMLENTSGRRDKEAEEERVNRRIIRSIMAGLNSTCMQEYGLPVPTELNSMANLSGPLEVSLYCRYESDFMAIGGELTYDRFLDKNCKLAMVGIKNMGWWKTVYSVEVDKSFDSIMDCIERGSPERVLSICGIEIAPSKLKANWTNNKALLAKASVSLLAASNKSNQDLFC